MKPGQSPSGGNNKAQFVICEICDGYIKDLEQLRNHMQWMHKVKVSAELELSTAQSVANGFYLSCYSDTSQDDLQSSTVELSEVSVPFLYGPGSGKTFAGLTWLSDKLYAGGG